MKSSWINEVDPKSNDQCLYKKRRITEVTQRERYMVMETVIGIMQL